MKAVIYDKKGSPDKLVLSEVEKPVPGDDEVLIRVQAVSLNAADYRSMKMGIIPKKKIFGADVAGIIESAGKNIKEFRPGDEVMGDLASYGFGGLAEYVTAPETLIVHRPAGVTPAEAASLPMAAMTALQALRDKGGVREGHEVLIVGSAGGVGTFAVQLARYLGCEVTGVCSTRNIEQTLSLGARKVIDYTERGIFSDDQRYDLIIAVNGNYPLTAYRRALKPGGTYVMVGGSLSQVFRSIILGRMLSSGSRKMKFLSARASRTDLAFLSDLLQKGTIRPVIDRRYPLEDAAQAMAYLQEGHSSGKIIIDVEPLPVPNRA
jgi:NADPH:quinone reductase-like Zn-dependent oxidoreductase